MENVEVGFEPASTCMTAHTCINPIPTGHGRNQPIYERHLTTAGRNRVNI